MVGAVVGGSVLSAVSGLDDFELICFLVVKKNNDRYFEGSTEYRVVIAGSRSFDNYDRLSAELDQYLKGKENVTIISGTATFYYDGEAETVAEGQVHYCPEGHSHYMENNTDKDLCYLAIVPEHHI